MGMNTGRGKVVYNWISPDPAKAGPTLGGVVVAAAAAAAALTCHIYIFFLSVVVIQID